MGTDKLVNHWLESLPPNLRAFLPFSFPQYASRSTQYEQIGFVFPQPKTMHKKRRKRGQRKREKGSGLSICG
jgi:hypothetical protein